MPSRLGCHFWVIWELNRVWTMWIIGWPFTHVNQSTPFLYLFFEVYLFKTILFRRFSKKQCPFGQSCTLCAKNHQNLIFLHLKPYCFIDCSMETWKIKKLSPFMASNKLQAALSFFNGDIHIRSITPGTSIFNHVDCFDGST